MWGQHFIACIASFTTDYQDHFLFNDWHDGLRHSIRWGIVSSLCNSDFTDATVSMILRSMSGLSALWTGMRCGFSAERVQTGARGTRSRLLFTGLTPVEFWRSALHRKISHPRCRFTNPCRAGRAPSRTDCGSCHWSGAARALPGAELPQAARLVPGGCRACP